VVAKEGEGGRRGAHCPVWQLHLYGKEAAGGLLLGDFLLLEEQVGSGLDEVLVLPQDVQRDPDV
jgi:hypothetical protein